MTASSRFSPEILGLGAGLLLEQRASRRSDPEQRRLQLELVGFLGLVDLDVLLHAAHHRASQMFEPDRLLGDLAQRDDRVLVVVAIERQRSAGGDLAGALCREQDELEAVRDLEDTIFDSDARHSSTLRETRRLTNIWGTSAGGNTERHAPAQTPLRLTPVGPGAYIKPRRPDGRVAMQRTANPRTAVRFRFRPPGVFAPTMPGALIPGSSVGRASGC